MSLATIPASVSVRSRGRARGAEVVPLDQYRARAAAPPVPHAAPVVRRAPEAVPAEPPLRLTRRGRAVVRLLLGLLVLAAVLAGVLAGGTALGGAEPVPTRTTELVVLPGETLWSIAGEVAPDTDRRETVAQLVELNDLTTQAVHAGQRLAVPAP